MIYRLILIFFVIVIGIYIFFFQGSSVNIQKIHINSLEIEVEIVDTNNKRIQGLSGRDFLGEKNGMLYIFPIEDYYSIWMKDMKFSIDVIWADKTGRIVDISENIHPNSFPDKYMPGESSKYILELNKGVINQNNLKIGDFIENLP